MLELKDNGYGVTVKSLEFWDDNKLRIGKIKTLEASKALIFSCFEHTLNGFLVSKEYTVKIVGEKGVIYLSGCNSGYGGEGPNGTRKILEDLGVNSDIARIAMVKKHFIYYDDEEKGFEFLS